MFVVVIVAVYILCRPRLRPRRFTRAVAHPLPPRRRSPPQQQQIRVWDYDESQPLGTGVGHSAGIRQVCISPDQETIVSVGAEGAVFVWSMPSLEPAT